MGAGPGAYRQGNASWTLAGHDSGYPANRMFAAGGELRAWFTDREDNSLALIAAEASLANLDLAQAAGALRANIEALGEFFDVCLIDTAPSLGVAMTAAVLAAETGPLRDPAPQAVTDQLMVELDRAHTDADQAHETAGAAKGEAERARAAVTEEAATLRGRAEGLVCGFGSKQG